MLLPIQGKLQSNVEDVVKFKINAFAPNTVICALCKIKIYKNESITLPDYSKFSRLSVITSSNSEACRCFLCDTLRNRKSNKKRYIKKGRDKNKSVEERCAKCFSVIHKGISHKCNELENFSKLADKDPDHIASVLLKKKYTLLKKMMEQMIQLFLYLKLVVSL